MKHLFLLFACFFSLNLMAQNPRLHFLEYPDTLHKKRLYTAVGGGLTIYSGLSIAFWNTWYTQSEISSFHTFNDFPQWNQMDKGGHFFSAWTECNYAFQGAKWTGMKRKNAIIVAASVGTGLQATTEIFDGFVSDYGFSWSDIAANTLGVTAFVTQELVWKEQRIKFKVSSTRTDYPTDPLFSIDGNSVTTLRERAHDLYGEPFYVTLMKDYNDMNLWATVNIHSFLPNKQTTKFPKWLNIAAGYGAQNLYGGTENRWEKDGAVFQLDPNLYPRYRQFFLSFDVDMARLPVKNRFLRGVLGALNWVKIPAPTLEINTLGNVKFHPIYW